MWRWISIFFGATSPVLSGAVLVGADRIAVRTEPRADAPIRGWTEAGAAFRVLGPVEGSGCAVGWARVEAGGYVCREGTRATDARPEPQPPLLAFDPPEPGEYETYVRTGEYQHDDDVAIVPEIYGRRWRRFDGRLYASVEAWVRGDEPATRMTGRAGERLGFLRVEETVRGPVLVRADGQVAPLSDVYLYPVSRLEGRDLQRDAGPVGTMPAIAVSYGGTVIRARPDAASEEIAVLPYHTWISVDEDPDPSGRWWAVRDGGDVVGWVDDREGIRHPVPSPGRPAGVDDDELWVDVVLDQQALTLWRGDTALFFTVISTGIPDRKTPIGEFRVLAKHSFTDMASRPDAEDWYRVEDVPWTLAFRPRYALHGAYWHWGFGRPASHGCINLAPRDAAFLFSTLEPELPDGWRSIHATPGEGSVIRIR